MKYTTKFKSENLKFNSITGTLCQAIWLIESKTKLEEQSWDGINYNISDIGGRLGTISFINEKEIVGVFFDKNSKKNPFIYKNNILYNYHDLLNDIPENLIKIAEQEALQYMIQELKGKEESVITSAIWSENKNIITNESWDSAWENGLSILEKHLLPITESLQSWQEYYDLTNLDIKWVLKIANSTQNGGTHFSEIEKDFLNYIKTKKNILNGIKLFEKHLTSIKMLFKIN